MTGELNDVAGACPTAWAEQIRPHLHQAAASIVQAGRLLIDAKAELPHGQFGPLLADLGLSRQMANRFMRVAANPVIANRSPVGGLPPAVSVLDVLARLEDQDLDAAIQSGKVTASTTRTEAERLVSQASDLARSEAEDLTEQIRVAQLALAQMFFDEHKKLPAGSDGHPDPAAVDLLFTRFDETLAEHSRKLEPAHPLADGHVLEGMFVLLMALIRGQQPDPRRPWSDQGLLSVTDGVQ